MTMLCTVQMVCPVCDRGFEARTVVATDALGGNRTDFHERATGAQPLPYCVHSCRRCGFTSLERDFAGDAEVTPTLRAHVWNELAPLVDSSLVTGSEKYEAAAKVAMWFDCVPEEVIEQRGQQWLLDAARQQRNSPREWFA